MGQRIKRVTKKQRRSRFFVQQLQILHISKNYLSIDDDTSRDTSDDIRHSKSLTLLSGPSLPGAECQACLEIFLNIPE